jgi:hypothetical protein
MACSSCGGRARSTVTTPVNRNAGVQRNAPVSAARVVDSQSITSKRVNTPVASNPNSPSRTKV